MPLILVRASFVGTAARRNLKGVLVAQRVLRLPPSNSFSPSPSGRALLTTLRLDSSSASRRQQIFSASMSLRRRKSNASPPPTDTHPNGATTSNGANGHEDHDDHEGHTHENGGLFHAHAHSHGDQSAEAIVKLIRGEGLDKGTKITLLGLLTNVGLTAVKGAAGWFFHSAALLAEAGHSLSDLLADFVTLLCWRTSRKPPNDNYPYGYGKFETFGTATVSLLLIGAALAIGHHSYSTVLHVLQPTIEAMPAGAAHEVLNVFVNANLTALDAVRDILPHSHSHTHTHSAAHGVKLVDINAAWFALASVIVKEWIYRLTKKVADEEKSPVLDANALHHRSDAYSSAIALMAIVGSWAIPGLPLDAIGGTVISVLILRQGVGLFAGAMHDLTDAGVNEATRKALASIVNPLVTPTSLPVALDAPSTSSILGIRNIKAIKAGSRMFVDLTADVSPTMTMRDAHSVESRIRSAIMSKRTEVREVRVHLHALEDGQDASRSHGDGPC